MSELVYICSEYDKLISLFENHSTSEDSGTYLYSTNGPVAVRELVFVTLNTHDLGAQVLSILEYCGVWYGCTDTGIGSPMYSNACKLL